MAEERRPHAGVVSNVPKKYRDVYWCWINNEPEILTYKDDLPYCTGCHLKLTFPKGKPWYEDDSTMHEFMFHVWKPGRGEAALASPKS